MTKDHILGEIRRTAAQNAGKGLGAARFYSETGIKESDWLGRYWARWGDALREAGLEPNQLKAKLSDEHLLQNVAILAKKLGRFPAMSDIRLEARKTPGFPSRNTLLRWGTVKALADRTRAWCLAHGDPAAAALCETTSQRGAEASAEVAGTDEVQIGTVYLLKSGRYYKIGRSNAVGRRERELAIQLPEKARMVHAIKTDDPPGIEAYWHRRFQDRRKNGEWFKLEAGDVAAFRRRRFM